MDEANAFPTRIRGSFDALAKRNGADFGGPEGINVSCEGKIGRQQVRHFFAHSLLLHSAIAIFRRSRGRAVALSSKVLYFLER
ncbi:hypothetical protein D9M72_543460 [compost metagenome]